jgi:serine/threonine protein kinase
MLVGKDPYHHHDPLIIYQNILKNRMNFPKIIDRDAKSLINHLLVQDPNKRFGCLKSGISDIRNHRLYNDFRWRKLNDNSLEAPFKPDFEDEKSIISKYYDEEKINVKIKEKYDISKEESERIKKESQENKNAKTKKVNLIEGIEIIDSDTEAKEILESEDPFIDW